MTDKMPTRTTHTRTHGLVEHCRPGYAASNFCGPRNNSVALQSNRPPLHAVIPRPLGGVIKRCCSQVTGGGGILWRPPAQLVVSAHRKTALKIFRWN